MAARIRYSRRPDGILQSRKTFIISQGEGDNQINAEVFLHIDEEKKKFYLVNSTDLKVLIEGGNTRNNAVLRIQAKKTLLDLGVNFASESRRGRSESKSI